MDKIMTEDDAILTAANMRNQGIAWDTITSHLKAAGFVSKKTKIPWSEMNVRLKVGKFLKGDQDDVAADRSFHVKPAADDFVNACKHLIDTPDTLISNAMKKSMIVALLNASTNDRQ